MGLNLPVVRNITTRNRGKVVNFLIRRCIPDASFPFQVFAQRYEANSCVIRENGTETRRETVTISAIRYPRLNKPSQIRQNSCFIWEYELTLYFRKEKWLYSPLWIHYFTDL